MKVKDGVKFAAGWWLFKLCLKLAGLGLFVLAVYLLSR